MRPLFVSLREEAVTDGVGGEDGGQTAFHGSTGTGRTGSTIRQLPSGDLPGIL